MQTARMILALAFMAAVLPGEKPAHDVRLPRVIKKVEPQYTERARAAGVQGTVILEAMLDEYSRLHGFSVSRGLGYGLDENAIRCARQWEFEPATRDGVPTAVPLALEVIFRLPPAQ
jgi:protein TonB